MKYVWILMVLLFQQNTFKQDQQKFQRVKAAYTEKETELKRLFQTKTLDYTGFNLFLRAFKSEQKLEVWIKAKNTTTWTLLSTYDFCSVSGVLGPKRKEGDLQIPEGIYHINHFNPLSNFHLSLGINYPNAADKIFSNKQHPGGNIYIHGNCVTIGCIPITDDKIKELYVLAVEARNNGQTQIPVHIFPSALHQEGLNKLRLTFSEDHARISFWENLAPVYADFEKSKQLKKVQVNTNGKYYLE